MKTNKQTRVEPIKPNDITDNLEDVIHPAVIEAVNTLLKQKYRGNEVNILQEDIVELAIKIDPKLTSNKLFEEKHMDFERLFRKAGWKVSYDKPAYNESYKARFTFSSSKRN